MTKLTVAFNPDYGVWDIQAFRDLIKDFQRDTTEIEFYMITSSTDTDFTDSVVAEVGLDSTQVFIEADDAAILSRLQNLKILIYLTGKIESVTYFNTNYPLVLQTPPTGCQTILVDNLLDRRKLQPMYVTHLQFWIEQITKYLPNGEEKEC